MKIKDLIDKEFKVTLSGKMISFTKEDMEKVGDQKQKS